MAGEFAGKAGFAKIDGDASPDLVTKYEVEGYPTTIIFKDGKEVERVVGADDAGIRSKLDGTL